MKGKNDECINIEVKELTSFYYDEEPVLENNFLLHFDPGEIRYVDRWKMVAANQLLLL